MTSNQIAYFKAKIEEAHYGRADQEQARSNRANEALTAMRNEYENAHYLRSDAENARANKAREAENYRSNVARESIEWAQIPAKNAANWSSAEKNYAEAGLKYAETAFTDQKARNTIADTYLKQQQAVTEQERQKNVAWDTELKKTQGEKNISDVEWAPYYAFATVTNAVGNIFGNAGKILGGINNGKTETGFNKETRRWYEDGIQYETTRQTP